MNLLLSGPDFFVIILYNAILIAIGVVLAKRKIKTAADFTTASQSLGLFTVSGSIISTCMGASILFSNFELVHTAGIKGLLTGVFWYGGWVILIFLVSKMRDTGATSIPGYIAHRYSPRARKIAAWATVCSGLSTCAAQFKSIGATAHSLDLCDPNTGIVIGAVIIVLFTFFSGMWGSSVTNSIQSIFILIVCAVVVPLTAANAAGGLSSAMANIDPLKLSFKDSSMSSAFFFSYFLSSTLMVAVHPSYSQYSLAAKNTKTAVGGQAIAWIVCTIVWVISATPALWISQVFPDMTNGALFVPRLVATFLPVGVRGFVIAIVLSLLITTGNSFLLLLSSTIADEIIKPMNPNMGDKKLIAVTRLIIAVGAAAIAVIAIAVPDIFTAFKIGGNAFGAVVGIPVMLSLFWKGVNRKAVGITMILACVTSIGLDVIFVATGGNATGNIYACIVSIIGCILGSIYMNAKENITA